MAQLQYMPGDPRLVDQLVYELKSKGIFDQFRKECIADVDTRPAYQNLRQRVETSVSTFLSRQCWKPDLNKNQLREKLRKHILDGNYLEQGVERIVDQVVNPKVASVFIPQVEDLVYNYLGIPRKKIVGPETDKKPEDLLPTDLEAVSPGSVKSNDDKNEAMETDQSENMDVEPDQDTKETKEEKTTDSEKKENLDIEMSEVTIKSNDSESLDKSSIPLPAEEIKLENIPAPVNSPPKATKVELDSIALPKEPNVSTDIPLPEEAPKTDKDAYFKPIQLHSDDSGSSSDSSLRRNMSPLTPIRNFNNENSCDAQQGFENDSDFKSNEKAAPSSFRFTIESKDAKENPDSNLEIRKETDKNTEQVDLSYQFTNQVKINTYNTPMYDDSSNSNNLRIDYESDVNSKTNIEMKTEIENSLDSKKDKKSDDRKSHKSSHRSRDSSRHSSSKDKRSDSKHSTSRDSSRHDKKSSKDDKNKSSKERDRSKDRSDRKDKDSSKHHDSSRSSHRSSKDKDSKSHRSSSSSHRHSSKSSDEKKSSSSKDKEKISESSRDRSKDKPRDSKSSSSKSDKDRKSSSSKKSDDKDKKKEKKDIDDHYSSSGRGNHSRRSTDRDSNDGSSSSKGSQNHNGTKSAENKKDSKSSSSKSDNTSTSGESPSPSDKEHIVKDDSNITQVKPVIRVDNHLETPIATPPRLPFVPDITLKKPKFAANFQEAKKLMKMRKFLDEEQKRMNQEAALLLEFQANVRPSLSQVYSSISGPELEFACVAPVPTDTISYEVSNEQTNENIEETNKDMNMEAEQPEIIISGSIQNPNENSESMVTKDIKENIENIESIQEQIIDPDQDSSHGPDDKKYSYDENKPFSELMEEIIEYSKASETKAKTDIEETLAKMEDFEDSIKTTVIQNSATTEVIETSNSIENKYFEVTIITEELSESEDTVFEQIEETIEEKTESEIESADSMTNVNVTEENTFPEEGNTDSTEPNVVFTEIDNASTEKEDLESTKNKNITSTEEVTPKIQNELQYFAEHEKYNAELERHEFSNFLANFLETVNAKQKIYLLNCDTYEENILKEVALTIGDFEIVNYYKNGHLKVPNTTTNIVKDVSLTSEVILPVESKKYEEKSPLFSLVKSECSFELSDYDTKLDDINKKSRQEVMEIILGSIIDSSPSKMPEIDYYTESAIEKEMGNTNTEVKSEIEDTISEEAKNETENLKRSIDEVESSVNNNRSVLTPKKIRKLSDSDQISSTTEESEEASNNNKVSTSTRSKYLGRARRVGLPRPKRNNLSNSPSSDKSVENYIQNTPPPPTPNGKIKTTPRTKVQRYDTSDLYKPKLHYLSRRHNVS